MFNSSQLGKIAVALQELNPVSVAWSNQEYFYTPPPPRIIIVSGLKFWFCLRKQHSNAKTNKSSNQPTLRETLNHRSPSTSSPLETPPPPLTTYFDTWDPWILSGMRTLLVAVDDMCHHVDSSSIYMDQSLYCLSWYCGHRLSLSSL